MQENKFDYVDLGLSVMWATYNVGATRPEDSGLLFQFGRVDGYKYDDENNKFTSHKDNYKITGNIYIPQTTSTKEYNKSDVLNILDDPAHVNIGSKWRMPTKVELEELLNNTKHIIKTHGIEFISKINGNSILIPFSSGYNGHTNNFFEDKTFGCIYSSQVYDFCVEDTYCMVFDNTGFCDIREVYRCHGYSVRGVFKK